MGHVAVTGTDILVTFSHLERRCFPGKKLGLSGCRWQIMMRLDLCFDAMARSEQIQNSSRLQGIAFGSSHVHIDSCFTKITADCDNIVCR
jgi:hypothetical protein